MQVEVMCFSIPRILKSKPTRWNPLCNMVKRENGGFFEGPDAMQRALEHCHQDHPIASHEVKVVNYG